MSLNGRMKISLKPIDWLEIPVVGPKQPDLQVLSTDFSTADRQSNFGVPFEMSKRNTEFFERRLGLKNPMILGVGTTPAHNLRSRLINH